MVAVATTDAILLTRHAKEIGVAPARFRRLRRRLRRRGLRQGAGAAERVRLLLGRVVRQSQRPADSRVRQDVPRQVRHPGRKEHEVEGYAIIYVIADAMRRVPVSTGNLDADREAIRQALLKTDMTRRSSASSSSATGRVRSATSTRTSKYLLAGPLGARAMARRQAPERLAKIQRRDQLCLPGHTVRGQAAPPSRPIYPLPGRRLG